MAKKKATTRKKPSTKGSDTKNKQLVIVESPAKARTINRYLGSDFVVMASVGHVRDLPSKNPKGVKDPVPGVDLDNDFKPTYQVIKGKGTTVKNLKTAAKNAKGIWLATDLDREGEAIAWHLAEALGIEPEKSKRVVFNAITKSEIEKAFLHPHRIDMNKVNAQQARRILDRIVGYQVSPLLWKKVAGGLSAGRVQSVAVRLLVEREREIEDYKPEEYWRLTGYFTKNIIDAEDLAGKWHSWLKDIPEKQKGRRSSGRTIHEKNEWLTEHESLSAELIELDGRKIKIKDSQRALEVAELAGFQLEERIDTENVGAKGPARKVVRLLGHMSAGPSWHVNSIKTKRTKTRPFAPFITSTLQQTAANQLGFTAQTTMRTAQTLYEGVTVDGIGSVGLITYMRTDSTHLAADAIKMARELIGAEFGPQYLPPNPQIYASSNKAAQEAHEAIRPTDVTLTPNRVRSSLNEQQFRLYRIIWERFVACQMTEAQWDNTTILILGTNEGKELLFRAAGRILVFDGQYRVTGIPRNSEEAVLPSLSEKESLSALHIDPTQNFTSPPPRYTEASLIKKLEAEGIGRPSTYAQIIQVIQTRKYAEKIQKKFYATDLGKVVSDKLIEAFPEILEVSYTREMERQLDNIEEKSADWTEMLRKFYSPFKKALDTAYQDMNHAKAETEAASYTCPQCGSGTVYRFGKNGRFLSCAAYPKCKYAAPIDREGNPVSPEQTDVACLKCGKPMLLRKGRFGLFLSCVDYPECEGIVNLDKKGYVSQPKTPPLLTDLECPKCGESLYIRRGARGPWLSCSKFPKCRGRLGWAGLDKAIKAKWDKNLEDHEKSHPQPVIRKMDGTPIGVEYKPQGKKASEDNGNEENEKI
ncbi:MAG: type I DNA topoisomerase [Deltaproteobacteria bacterium]|nr:type I DNA topoisomerase [Deltaproteobacteria bacterium]